MVILLNQKVEIKYFLEKTTSKLSTNLDIDKDCSQKSPWHSLGGRLDYN